MSEYIIGRNACLELLNSDRTVDKIYIQKGEQKGSILKIIGKAKSMGIHVQEIDRRKLEEITNATNHQGICALVSDFKYSSIQEILSFSREKGETPFLVFLDGIEDPHNLGAIIRTAEVAGVHGIIIPSRRSASINATVEKTSAGATSYMKVAQVTNLSRAIEEVKKENIFVYGADGEAKSLHTKTNLTGPIALVIGNEGKGISQNIKKHCDELIKIPMFGKVGSLNASNAAAILIYEILRQRGE